MKRLLVYILPFFLIFSFCKKEKAPAPVAPSGPLDITINSFPSSTGNQWIYSSVMKYTFLDLQTNFTTNTSVSSCFTVTIVGDSTLPNSTKGKIWRYDYGSGSFHKRIAYYDSTSKLFYLKTVGNVINIKDYSFILPLTKNKTWVNLGLTPQDTCASTTADFISIGKTILPVINASRKQDYANRDFFRINEKGLVQHTNIRIEILGTVVYTYEDIMTLTQTNF